MKRAGARETYDQQHKVLENGLEMRVPWYRNRAVNHRPDKCPDEARHRLRPWAQNLQAEGHAVHVGAIVRNDAQREHHQAKLTEATERWEQHRRQQSADAGIRVTLVVWVDEPVRTRRDGRGRHGHSEDLGEEQGEDQAAIGPGENFRPGDGPRLIDGVIGRQARPAGAEAEDAGREAQHRSGFRLTRSHRNLIEAPRMGKFANHDEEDDETRDPRPEFVQVHQLVSEHRDEKRGGGNDDDACVAFDVGIDGVEELGAHNHIDRTPADARQDIEDRDWIIVSAPSRFNNTTGSLKHMARAHRAAHRSSRRGIQSNIGKESFGANHSVGRRWSRTPPG